MRRAMLISSLVALAAGCLPGDERPEPGSVLVNVARSDDARDGFTTDDGWRITFERFVTAIGVVAFTGSDDCIPYDPIPYDRLYDFTVADDSKVSLHYGLGACALSFQLRSPSTRSILMQGVSESDRVEMNLSNTPVTEEIVFPITLWVIGRATRDDASIAFDWQFRRSHTIGTCHPPTNDDDDLSAITLRSGESHVRDIVIRPRELFRITPSVSAPIHFSRIAVADANGDGVVTVEELEGVEVESDAIADDIEDELPEELRGFLDFDIGKITLRDLIGKLLTGRVAALSGSGECEVFYHL